MDRRTAVKKKPRKAAKLLVPVMALLIVALIGAAVLYYRLGADTENAQGAIPTPSVGAPAAQSGHTADTPQPTAQLPEQPESTPYRPVELQLSVISAVESIDIVVCDADGNAVPGYFFPLEICIDGGTSHTVATDINGRYFADYMLPGSYTVSMPEYEGFVRPESVKCVVEERLDYVPIANIEEYVQVVDISQLSEEEVQPAHQQEEAPVEVEEISTTQTEEDAKAENPESEILVGGTVQGETLYTGTVRYFKYSYETGPNGFLLLADGSESEVLPIEEGGMLAYGIRKVTDYYDIDGKPIKPEDIPEGAVEGKDFYIDEYSEKVELILGEGVVDRRYSITAEESEKEVAYVSAIRVGWQEENGKIYYYDSKGRPVTGLKNIDGKLYFFDGTGARAEMIGLDVSYFNASIDWRAVKAAGIDFVIVRVAGRTWNKGILFEDEDSYRQGKDGGFYLQGAKEAGLLVGAYVYSNAVDTNEAVEEASLALEVVAKSGVTLDMPIYLDLEFSGEYPGGRADKLSLTQRAEIVKAFCSTIEEGGYQAGVYAGEDFFNRALRFADVEGYDVWYATYTYRFELPRYRGFDIWQFSESVRVNGMPDHVDMNVIF